MHHSLPLRVPVSREWRQRTTLPAIQLKQVACSHLAHPCFPPPYPTPEKRQRIEMAAAVTHSGHCSAAVRKAGGGVSTASAVRRGGGGGERAHALWARTDRGTAERAGESKKTPDRLGPRQQATYG